MRVANAFCTSAGNFDGSVMPGHLHHQRLADSGVARLLQKRVGESAPEVELQTGVEMDEPNAEAQEAVADLAGRALALGGAEIETRAGQAGVEVPRREGPTDDEPRRERPEGAQGTRVLGTEVGQHEIHVAAVVQDPRDPGVAAGEDAVVHLVVLDLQVVVEEAAGEGPTAVDAGGRELTDERAS